MNSQAEAEALMQKGLAETQGDTVHNHLYNAKEKALAEAGKKMQDAQSIEQTAHWSDVMARIEEYYNHHKNTTAL